MATPLCSMIVPLIPMHSNTVIRGEAFVLAGGDEFLSLPAQELHQVNGVGTEFLVSVKWIYGTLHPSLSKKRPQYAASQICVNYSVGWHLSELLDLIPTPIDHSGSVTGKVPERVTEKEKKISELLVEAPEAINGSPQVHTSYASH